MLKQEIVLEQLKKIKEPKVVIEIGTQFFPSTDPRAKTYGCVTEHLAQYCKEVKATFYTVDIEPEHTQFILNLAQEQNLPINVINSDGNLFLSHLRERIDFLYLDSADDPKISFEQFKTVEPYLTQEAIVVIDDIKWWNNFPTQLEGKGSLLLPYCRKRGYSVQVIKADHGGSMGIISGLLIYSLPCPSS